MNSPKIIYQTVNSYSNMLVQTHTIPDHKVESIGLALTRSYAAVNITPIIAPKIAILYSVLISLFFSSIIMHNNWICCTCAIYISYNIQ